ncbi:DUF4058 family protein [filamentous cyanobacterium LEGE 07170]|nr:DUF4058 family protein [filamentous cyanobacterium LEGE 07170]
MRSPFPGMNPYLESAELWSEVHSRLIVGIADELSEHLSEKYRVAIEKRTYWDISNPSLMVGIPDVSVVTQQTDRPQQTETSPETATTTLVAQQPTTVTLPIPEEIQERYLEIREVATGAVITAIEVLSPKNKRSGEGRRSYERKRNHVLNSLTHLMEIDLLREGEALPFYGGSQSDYRILISRSDRRPSGQLYAFNVRQSIPVVAVPLAAENEEVLLDLQTVLHQLYQRGRYHLAIDYQKSPHSPLSEEATKWMDTLLKEAGIR